MRQFNTALEFILSASSLLSTNDLVSVDGYTLKGDGGEGVWKHNGVIGQTASQSPAQLGNGLLNDASGNQWELVDPYKRPPEATGMTSFTIYVSTSGDDANGGLSSLYPLLTLQAASDEIGKYAPYAAGDLTVDIAAGTYTEGAVFDQFSTTGEIVINGKTSGNTPTVVIDGSSAVNINGFNFNRCNVCRVIGIEAHSFSRDGVVFQNGTDGVLDTVNLHDNLFSNADCNENSTMNIVGVSSFSPAPKIGVRYYGNSLGSIGDGENVVTIDNAIESGLLSRDGSHVVCDDNLVISNCSFTSTTSAVRIYKNSYVELRTTTLDSNSIGIFAENGGIYDNQSGIVAFTANVEDKRFIDLAMDRSVASLNTDISYTFRPSRVAQTGEEPSSNYDMVLDVDSQSGFQVLNNDNTFNFDVNKTQRVNFNSDGTIRLITDSLELIRLNPTVNSNKTGLFLLVNDGATTSLRRVEVGAADSGGAGQRLLSVPN